jgi:undecaprenyl-diphosphatase
MLAYLAICHTERRWHLLIVSATIALILLVGNSRIFLQVHFFSDVLAGFCSGAAWLVICVIATEIAQRQRSVTRSS